MLAPATGSIRLAALAPQLTAPVSSSLERLLLRPATLIPGLLGSYGRAGDCIRLQVLQQGADLEATVVENDGTVFRNDDSGLPGCFLCSLVKFVATDTGWKTVNLSHFAGNPVYSDFRVSYGRYSGGAANANCSNPTTPTAAAAAAVAKSGGSAAVTGDGTQR